MQSDSITWRTFRYAFGPGLVMAAAAIGVSHLVQSTRAGAEYGFSLIGIVLLVNLFKYPFLEFGPRYAVATGEHLIAGYRKLGRWAIGLFILFTFGTVFAIQAVVTLVTASLATPLTGIELSVQTWSVIIVILCTALLIRGNYAVLDRVVKLFLSVLAISTLFAVTAALVGGGHSPDPSFQEPEIWSLAGITFLIALMGWMPIPLDVAVWHSIWTLERSKQTSYQPSLKESLTDFQIGYAGAAIFAVLFLILGAQVMYGSGESFAATAGAFSQQLIQLFTQSLGEWAFFIIVISAFSTMFSTTFTVIDTYPRVVNHLLAELFPSHKGQRFQRTYPLLLVLLSATSLGFLLLMGDRFRLLIDLATTLSFLVAPGLAWMNYKLITGPHVDAAFQPGKKMRILSVAGLVFLTLFALFYLGVQLASL